jgi:hypothetical protein
MSFKRFQQKDIVNNTMVAKPEFNFIVHSGSTFLQRERSVDGNFSNTIKHIESGHVSLHELNINRPSDSLIYSFIEKDSTRYSFKTITTTEFDSESTFGFGSQMTSSYPVSASLSRIYVPAGIEFNTGGVTAHVNKKYIRALKNPISSSNVLGPSNKYGSLGTSAVNMICAPGIFAGSGIDKGSIELNYYVTGTLVATAKDLYSDGRMIQTYGSTTSVEVGMVVYNQGIILLTSSTSLHTSTDKFFSPSSTANPSWLSFGTGLKQAGLSLSHGDVEDSSYSINFKGTNKIPTLTMFAFSEKGEHNFSKNPTFLSRSSGEVYFQNKENYRERQYQIKKVNKSPYADHQEEFQNVTYISKVGIYDKDKNLIAIASLANPVKNTEKRDFMFKMKIDF